MISPDFTNFKKLARKGNLIAVSRTVPADLETPVSSFLKLAKNNKNAFLFESAEYAEQIGRYSIIGLDPSAIYSYQNGRITLQAGKVRKQIKTDKHIIDVLESELKKYKLANQDELPEFCGGFVGFFSYENVQYFEKVKLTRKKGPKVPDAIYFLMQDFLIFDHFKKSMKFVSLIHLKNKTKAKSLYKAAEKRIAASIEKLKKPLKSTTFSRKLSTKKMKSNINQSAYEKKVKRVKEYIKAGDCIQVVLSQRFTLNAKVDDFQIYRSLRSLNPSPFLFYFRSGKYRLIGSSPELLVKKDGRDAEVRPIAGTRPRGETSKKDLAYEENLKKSPKEKAEHLMLVDLGRNDLGRVCDFNSVKVKNYARVERYSHVMHLVSDVIGKLKNGKTAFDLLKATFPAGTVTGAPKIRAMQIIDELEPEKRGPYAGSVGYFSFNKDMETCIAIRTLVVEGSKIYVQAGAGIVKDSDPKREYQETVNKAKALVQALEKQELF